MNPTDPPSPADGPVEPGFVPDPASLSRDQARRLDELVVSRFGIPSIVLMENAGRSATDFLLSFLAPRPNDRILVVAGRGNNGGDGFVIARHLSLRGFSPRVLVLSDPSRLPLPGDAGANLEILLQMGVPVLCLAGPEGLSAPVEEADILVDAILGTGVSGVVRGTPRRAIEILNAAGSPTFAVDLPSGLDCDLGVPLGVAVRAAATGTFVARKRGFDNPASTEYTGRVEVLSIGAPVVAVAGNEAQ